MNQKNNHLLGTHVWQLQTQEKQFLLGTDIWQLINKDTKFGGENFQAGYPKTLFFYLLNRGGFLKDWETRIKDLKKKLHFLLLERMKNEQNNLYER